MIAQKQLQRALEQLILSCLQSGRIPTSTYLLTALRQCIPTPGQPISSYQPQQNGTPLDITAYNAVWGQFSTDFTLLYDQLYDHVSRAATAAERLASWSAGLQATLQQLSEVIATVNIDETIIGSVSAAFHTNAALDLGADTNGPHTTALLDYANGVVTLPIDTTSFTAVSLAQATLTGAPVTGTEQPIVGNALSTLLPDVGATPWMTQVLDGGGGTSYVLTLTLPAPVSMTTCTITLTHQQAVVLAYQLPDQSWTSTIAAPTAEGVPQQIIGVRIILTRSTGVAQGNQFMYTFGIAGIALQSQSYVATAQAMTLPLTLDPQGHAASRVTLLANDSLPTGTTTAYALTLLQTDGTPVLMANGAPLAQDMPLVNNQINYLATAQPQATVVTETTATVVQPPPGLKLLQATLPTVVDYSLLEAGNGVFWGEGQWKVDAYQYDWADLPAYTPGPTDWDNLAQNGIQPNEVQTSYQNLERSAGTWFIAGDTGQLSNLVISTLPSPESQLSWTLAPTAHLPAPLPRDTALPPEPLSVPESVTGTERFYGTGPTTTTYTTVEPANGRANFDWFKDTTGGVTTEASVCFLADKTAATTSISVPWRTTVATASHGGYGAGNFGQWIITLCSDNGSGLPGTVLQTLGTPSAPLAVQSFMASDDSPLYLPFTTGLTTGHWYHIVFKNIDPTPAMNWSSMNTTMGPLVSSWSAWQAAQLTNYTSGQQTEARLLYSQDGGTTWTPWISQSDDWNTTGNNSGCGAHVAHVIKWADGTVTGDPYWSDSADSPAYIYGSNYKVGELFTWMPATITLTGVSLAVYQNGTPGPLTYLLESVGPSGTQLSSGTFGVQVPALSRDVQNWATVTFQTPVTLTQGQTYRLSFAAPQGSPGNSYEQCTPYAPGASSDATWFAATWGGPTSCLETMTDGQTWVQDQTSDLAVQFLTLATVTISAPTVVLTTSAAQLTAGQSAVLAWTSTNATGVTAATGTGFTPSAGAVSGTVTLTPVSTQTYSITVTNSGNTATATASVTITVVPAPIVPPPPPSYTFTLSDSTGVLATAIGPEGDTYALKGTGVTGSIAFNTLTGSESGTAAMPLRMDMVPGPFTERTVYRYSTQFYVQAPFTLLVPGSMARATDARFTTLYQGLQDLVLMPRNATDAGGASSDLYVTAYLNGQPLQTSTTGMNWVMAKGWNTLCLYVYCATDRTAPFALGVSLSPATWLLQDLTAIQYLPALPNIEFPCFDAITTTNGIDSPVANIIAVRSTATRLQACSPFDLSWNTPLQYQGRYAAEPTTDGTGTILSVPEDPTVRVVAYYDTITAAAHSAAIASVVLTLTLATSPQTLSSRPRIGTCQLIFN